MPIRLNLLAEAQAEEELRRRDPVKRALWLSGVLTGCVLIYFVALLIWTMVQSSALKQLESRLESQNVKFAQIMDNEKKLDETTRKLAALRLLSSSRFLWGNVLNALQQSTLDDVQLTKFRSEQTYTVTEEVKPKTEGVGHIVIGRPGFVTQKVGFFFDAKDTSASPGDQINKYKSVLAAAPFFGKGVTNANATLTLKNLSAPSYDAESGKTVVLFSLDCRFADKILK